MADESVTIADEAQGDGWQLWNGDCVTVARGLPTDSVHYTIYSPPFESLYTFSDDPRDMSNCRSSAQFWEHYRFLIAECFRISKPGRLVSVHCMQLPTSKLRDGFIGLRDFRGEIIRAHQEAGFIYHSEVCIRKDPVAAMQRSKSIGLLHKQVKKDSTISRMAVADYLVTMRKPGENPEPVSGLIDAYYGNETSSQAPLTYENKFHGRVTTYPGDERYSIAVWQRYAEPVWLDIDQGDVLSREAAREFKDERHISPLQLTVIRRGIDLWSNPGDIVFSPFAGIGSELYVALQMGRRGIGAELKASYFRQASVNCREAVKSLGTLFDTLPASDAAAQPSDTPGPDSIPFGFDAGASDDPGREGIQGSDGPGSRVTDNPRPHGESLQQGLDTSSNHGAAVKFLPQGEWSDAADVVKPEETSGAGPFGGAPRVPPGPSDSIPPMSRSTSVAVHDASPISEDPDKLLAVGGASNFEGYPDIPEKLDRRKRSAA